MNAPAKKIQQFLYRTSDYDGKQYANYHMDYGKILSADIQELTELSRRQLGSAKPSFKDIFNRVFRPNHKTPEDKCQTK